MQGKRLGIKPVTSMNDNKSILDILVEEIQERSKELSCLYIIEEALTRQDSNLDEAFGTIVNSIAPAWQYPNVTVAKISYMEKEFFSEDFIYSKWELSEDIMLRERTIGHISVFYTAEMPHSDVGPFTKAEKTLLSTIAQKINHYLLHRKLRSVFEDLQYVKTTSHENRKGKWKLVLEMLRKADPALYKSLLRKLLHHLTWNGIEEAERLMQRTSDSKTEAYINELEESNKPLKKQPIHKKEYTETILRLCEEHLNEDEIIQKINRWIQYDKSSPLVKAAENQDTSMNDLADAIRRYHLSIKKTSELAPSADKGLRVSLLRKFFTDQLDYIRLAKEYVDYKDFYEIIDRIIFPPGSHGKLGGKSAGLFLAQNILKKHNDEEGLLKDVTIPKTWYVASDCVMYFLEYNNLEEVIEQKYKDIDEVRLEYPHIVQVFKNATFPPELVKGLSIALDDFGDIPLIVRSSSLLEDQMGAAFSGKYKSLFLANQGSKQERLSALMDAIAEVYASTFSPDPIEYRAERGLVDFHEEMGVMIQAVVGKKIKDYYFPTFAGVAFSNNEFRWSPRIRREDGLLRLVPGLGTRAVDRLGDDYPILIAPGQPNMRVNVSVEETIRYSPSKIDVINLKSNEFETKEVTELLRECGDCISNIEKIISVVDGNHVRKAMPFSLDFEKDDLIVTFEGLISDSKFVKQMDFITKTIQQKLKTPIDIEFAHDGDKLYLLQCRPQSYSKENKPDKIPENLSKKEVIFTADAYVSNGHVPQITHLVYVDPLKYSELPDIEIMKNIGRTVGKLNKILPKRQFILMGPGRWGSRGDIKLGVSVTYSDINNTAMLIEIARKKGNYTPDLSFGTHFFQDLVEASIRYLPLYPDKEGIIFNGNFFDSAENSLTDYFPEKESIKDVLKVINVPAVTNGKILRVFMNADIDRAVALFADPAEETVKEPGVQVIPKFEVGEQWKWRYKIAQRIAQSLDKEKFGVRGVYIFGSSKNTTAKPESDIDLLVHVDGDIDKRKLLDHWFEGWSLCLNEMNYYRTGFRNKKGLLDIHYVNDSEVANKTGLAVKIGAISDAARPLQMK